jgi:hypothetical protein
MSLLSRVSLSLVDIENPDNVPDFFITPEIYKAPFIPIYLRSVQTHLSFVNIALISNCLGWCNFYLTGLCGDSSHG